MVNIMRDRNGKICGVISQSIEGSTARGDWHDYSAEQMDALAEEVSEYMGRPFVAVERDGYPKNDIVPVPRVGDPISYGFNGDYYPCGRISRVSPTGKVITSTQGHKFYRRGKTSKWRYNKFWSLVRGHISEWNADLKH